MARPSHLSRAIALTLIVLSPIGAPIVGVLLSACPEDASVRPDGPFAIGLSYCGMSRPLEHFYQQTAMTAVLPAPWLGRWGNALCALAWIGAGAASAIGALWHAWRALARVTIERI